MNGSNTIPVGMTPTAYFISLVFSCGTVIKVKRGRQLVPGWPVEGSKVFMEGMHRDSEIIVVKYCNDAKFGPQFSIDLDDCVYDDPFDIDRFQLMIDNGWKPIEVMRSSGDVPIHRLEQMLGVGSGRDNRQRFLLPQQPRKISPMRYP